MTAPSDDPGRRGTRTNTRGPGTWRAWLAALAGLVLLDLLLIAPNRPAAWDLEALRMVPLELPVLALAAVVWPRRALGLLAWTVGLLLAAASALKLADLAAYTGFGRAARPLMDLAHIGPALDFLNDALGTPGLVLALALTAAAIAGCGVAAGWSVRRLNALPRRVGRGPALAAAGALALAVAAGAAAQRGAGLDARTEAYTSDLVAWRVGHTLETLAELRRFRARLDDPAPATPGGLARLAGHDVLLVFVESYGRAALDQPRYASRTGPALARLEAAARSRGWQVRSAWLEAPTVGGSSWLSHASLLSGLWIDSQPRYEALLASGRATLIDRFEAAGWTSVAAMPAITRAWSAGAYYGYDRLLDADALDYAGPPFNWVSMPDQFTLDRLYRRELADPHDAPVFAEVALISSHAPWTPVPDLLPWDRIGDGRVYREQAARGDPPSAVWRDPDRVRRQYRKALGYSLDTVASFLRQRVGSDTAVLLLGDHPPAPIVTGTRAPRQVPVHLIAPPDIAAATDGWGWSQGARPAADAPVWRMDLVKAQLLQAFDAPDGDGPAKTTASARFGD
jgi:hypothetical protein